MVEVTKSTLTSAGVSDSGGAFSARAFDMHSWQGLTELLKAARESGMPKEAYHDFRDVVLEYAQSGGDAVQRNELDARIAKLDLGTHVRPTDATPVPEPERNVPVQTEPQPEAVKQKRPFGGARPTPVFGSVGEPTRPAEGARAEVRETEAAAPHALPVRAATNERVHVIVDAPAEQEAKTAPAPVAARSLDEYRARITEIKQVINKRVGNPAALIDVSNNAGRRYMNALLSAMKLLGAAKVSELEAAMDVLERAYAEVIAASSGSASETKAPAPEAPEEAAPPVDPPVSAPVIEEVEPAAPRQEPEKRETAIPLHDVPLPVARRSSAIPSLADLSSDVSPIEERGAVEAEQPMARKVAADEPEQGLAADRLAGRVENKYLTPNTKTVKATPEVQNDPPSSEVTVALTQLLSEWKLFRSSGIFGTGPSGHEHPLYKRLAGLSMFEVLAGRFEKATPEITQSIKDYVNSWRHEQGISYLPSETFETYLRRVVRRILKRQGK